MKTRKAAVSGKFYPKDKDELADLIKYIHDVEKKNFKEKIEIKKIYGGIVPHAGYIYSGYQAVHFFELVRNANIKFDTIIIVTPNHTGYGKSIALDTNLFWETPFGKVEIDHEFCNELGFEKSEEAHKYEHSGEVMLPFLQYFLAYQFKIVPICILQQNYDNAKLIAASIAETNKKLKKNILIIASTDFSHFEPPKIGAEKDKKVSAEILKFESKNVEAVVRNNKISVCGYGAIMVLMEYCKLISDKPLIETLKVGHSGEVHKSETVVDYISMLFYE